MRPLPRDPWRGFRRRQRTLAAVLVAYVPLVHGVGNALRTLTASEGAARALLSGWLTAAVAAIVWFARFRCPYCRNHFHLTVWATNPFATRCLHCGFEKLRDPHAARVYTQRR